MDDNGVFTFGFVRDHFCFGSHVDAAPTSTIGLHNARSAVDLSARGEIGSGDVLHQLVDADIRILQSRQAARYHFAQVVGRDIGGHPNRNTRRAIDQKVGDSGWQHRRYTLGAVVVIDEIDRFLVQVREQGMGDFGHANFGVAHGCGRVAVNRAEISLTVYQGVAQREILRHTNDGVING